jgi:ribosome-associated protein
MPTVDDTLTLSAALKLAGLADTGGQAKALIQGGHVRVNGEIETRRKHRLRAGDEIEVDGESFVIELQTEDSSD